MIFTNTVHVQLSKVEKQQMYGSFSSLHTDKYPTAFKDDSGKALQ